MFTDVVGYSATTQKNESLALLLLEEYRSVARRSFLRHGGREVKTIGDAFLVEFPSALGAVNCAIEIQKELQVRNESVPEDRKISIRIGIHLGDVIHKQDDVYGDAVNVAARIEPFAEPGGICVSQQVYDHIRGRVDIRFSSLGNKALKNIKTPIDLYRVVPERGKQKDEAMADRTRVAILPLANIGRDPENEYFADGLTEELISTVSRVKGLAVTSRTSVMKYKSADKDMTEVGRELGVGTVLEGSVRKGGAKVRVAVQLINVRSDEHLWSQTYDREIEDIFAIQSDIAQNVARALELQLLAEERNQIQRKPTVDMEAYTMYLKGRFCWNERSAESVKKAIQYFEKAIAKDSGFALAIVGLADCYIVLMDQSAIDPKEARSKARSLLERALQVDEGLGEAHASLANLLTIEWDWPSAEAEYKRAIELNPNYATAHHWYSLELAFMGRPNEAIAECRVALKLDPISPIVNLNLGLRLIEAGDFERGIEQVKRTLAMEPNFGLAHTHLGAAYIGRSLFQEGIAELLRAGELYDSVWIDALLGYAYALMGDKAAASTVLRGLEEASKSSFVPKALLGTVYFALGDKDAAFSLFVRSLDDRSNAMPYVKLFLAYREIRADPKFAALFEKIGQV
jgi:TolB-like protein/Flp pilus assembly protein TadD